MSSRQVINEWLQEIVDRVKTRIEPFIGDFEEPDLSPEQQRDRVSQVLNTGKEPDYTADHIAEHIWTLAIDAAHEQGYEEGTAIMVANMACEQLGYPRTANADYTAQLRKRYRQKSNLGAALRALNYKSFADAVNQLKMGDKEPKDIERELIYKALQGLPTKRRS